nr:triacylglycerol lipase-like 1 [Tanacetum cinerariifolium]
MANEVTTTTTCDKSFSVDYMLLSPKDVGLWDLIKLLLSKNIGNRKFIDCPDGTVEESFSQRFVIFISTVAQKKEKFMPTKDFLTFQLHDFHPHTGKMVLPNNESPDFLSAIGLWDIRRDLDARINHEDPRYTSALAIMAAKSAYENESYIKETVEKHWKMEFLGFFNYWNDYEEDYTTQGFMWSDKTGDTELIGVSFRGTSPFNARDWSSDVDLSWYHLQGIGKVRPGNVIERKGKVYQVVKAQHSTQGRGGAIIQVELRDVDSGNKVNERFRTDETVEKVYVEAKSYTYLYTDEETDSVVLMEPKTFVQLDVPKHLFGDSLAYLKDDITVSVELYNDKPMSASVPKRVTCTVVEAQAAMKGMGATPQSKREGQAGSGLNGHEFKWARA